MASGRSHNLKATLKDNFGLVFTCMHRACGIDFSDEESIRSHIAEKHQSKEVDDKSLKTELKRSFKCLFDSKKCGRKLDSLSQILNHICKSHLADSNRDGIDFRNIYICPVDGCGLGFDNDKSLKQHRNEHRQILPTPSTFDSAQEPLSDLVLNTQKPASTAKKHLCSKCGSSFQRPSHLKKHLLLHDKNSYECQICNEIFFKKIFLAKHVAEKHESLESKSKSQTSSVQESEVVSAKPDASTKAKRKPKEYKCPVVECGKEFRNSSKLARHVRIHSPHKMFRCTYGGCVSEFSRRDHLLTHLCLHKSVKQFSCPNRFCNSKFKYQSNLRTHMKSHLKCKASKTAVAKSLDEDNGGSGEAELDRFKIEFAGQMTRLSDDEKADENIIVIQEPSEQLNGDLLSPTILNSADSQTMVDQNTPPLFRDDESEIFESLASVLRSEGFENFGAEKSTGESARNEHIINMNSDDEEYASSVVLENLSGSARTDYRSNHFYINKNKQRCKKLKK